MKKAMTHQAIKHALERRPFRPFQLRLSDGSLVDIERENQLGLHPHTKKTVVYFDPDGGYHILDMALVTALHAA